MVIGLYILTLLIGPLVMAFIGAVMSILGFVAVVGINKDATWGEAFAFLLGGLLIFSIGYGGLKYWLNQWYYQDMFTTDYKTYTGSKN
jgi:hypothetical protein